jgi:hypothetical protein
MQSELFHAHSGSALRLSQPLSGFPADSSSTALFHTATVRGLSPSELSPHEDRVYLSRGHMLPCSYPPGCEGSNDRRLITTGFPDARTFGHACHVPPTAMGPLSTSRNLLPSRPGLRPIHYLLTPSFTCFEALIPP